MLTCITRIIDWFRACIGLNRITNEAFEKVYTIGLWGEDENGRGTSGYGSEPAFNTEYIKFMRDFIIRNNIKTVVDIGCGDWQFSNDIYKDMDLTYYGYDCVKRVIEENKERYNHIHKYHFKHINGDNILDNIKTTMDLLVLKDVIQHWPNEEIVEFLNEIKKNINFKYALFTNDHTSKENVDIAYGDYRPLNWSATPLNTFAVHSVFGFNTFDDKTTVKFLV